ncbi:MAG: hypothetical protein ACI8PT_004173 [Gammaproteobacteria bacterium]
MYRPGEIGNGEETMLVTFSCPAYANITMFGDVGVRLITLMGHLGKVPGAVLAEDVPAALTRLKAAIHTDEPSPVTDDNAQDQDAERVVSLVHRALPLLELLEAAAKAKCDVMWSAA